MLKLLLREKETWLKPNNPIVLTLVGNLIRHNEDQALTMILKEMEASKHRKISLQRQDLFVKREMTLSIFAASWAQPEILLTLVQVKC